MKKFKQYLSEETEDEVNERCWDGYKPTPGKKPYEKGSCMKEDDEELQEEAEHDGKKVTLNKPFRTPDGPKKFAVYVKNDKGNVVKVTFGDPDMEIKRDSDSNRANFRSRHNCDDPGPKWKARYWSCKMWSNKPVSKLTEEKTFHFDELDGPKTKRKVGAIVGAKGNSPEDALKQRMIPFGYRAHSITNKDGLIVVKAQWGSSPQDADTMYYRLVKTVTEEAVDMSQAAKLFTKFLRSTGAPDKVATFSQKNSKNGPIFVGSASNSKFDYAVDVTGGTVTATERGSVKNRSFVWNDKTGKLKINESAPPDSALEKWINENRQKFSKRYGSERGKQILYATAWRIYTNK
jgi:hypothetical protein